MPDEKRARATMDVALVRERKGEVFVVLGGTLLGMAAITCVWVLTGFRAGSWFWFWWTGALVVLGLGFVAAGIAVRSLAQEQFAAGGNIVRERIASRRENVPPEDIRPRAA